MSEKRGVGRRRALQTLGAAAAAPVLGGLAGVRRAFGRAHHPLVPVQDPAAAYAPRFLDEHELRTVAVLAERIVPETETPGARSARVDEYIDFTLSEAPDEGASFREGLRWLDETARRRYGGDFAELDETAQTALLDEMAREAEVEKGDGPGARFFRDVKQRTIEGYYTSEEGIVDELGYEGNTYLAEFEGCTHREHLEGWPPSAREGER